MTEPDYEYTYLDPLEQDALQRRHDELETELEVVTAERDRLQRERDALIAAMNPQDAADVLEP